MTDEENGAERNSQPAAGWWALFGSVHSMSHAAKPAEVVGANRRFVSRPPKFFPRLRWSPLNEAEPTLTREPRHQTLTGFCLYLERFPAPGTVSPVAEIVQRPTTEVFGNFSRLYPNPKTALVRQPALTITGSAKSDNSPETDCEVTPQTAAYRYARWKP